MNEKLERAPSVLRLGLVAAVAVAVMVLVKMKGLQRFRRRQSLTILGRNTASQDLRKDAILCYWTGKVSCQLMRVSYVLSNTQLNIFKQTQPLIRTHARTHTHTHSHDEY